MTIENKTINIAVLFGGCSPEYSVSLESASAVIEALTHTAYHPVMIGITKDGDWYYYTGSIQNIQNDTWHNPQDCTPAVLSPSRKNPVLFVFHADKTATIPLTAALPVLHGKNGEDGTVQGLIELAGIPLAGCGTLSSALCMDKDRAHRLVGLSGVRVPQSTVLQADSHANRDHAKSFAEEVNYPLFVKPVKAGSSYGITKVTGPDKLQDAITLSFQYDDEVILEENIDGFEVGCAVLGNGHNSDSLITGEIDEIELSEGFFDFTEKYTLKTSAIHLPARISPEKSLEIKETAKQIYCVLGCSGFARVDMFLTSSGEIVFNEVNTIPGFTAHSRYPGMMKAAGHSFEEILDLILQQVLPNDTENPAASQETNTDGFIITEWR